MMLTALEWLGCIFGVLGALLLALNNRAAGWGWVAFLVSNVFWLIFGLVTGTRGLVAMQLVFSATSMLGIYRWLLRAPRG